MAIFKTTIGNGEDIVLIHGWGGCNHKHMQPIANALAKDYTVTSIDLPGCGQSSWDSSFEDIFDIAKNLLSDLPAELVKLSCPIDFIWGLGYECSNNYP